ncbi:hypothetical protein V2J09_018630 [Rumex salicifolius]
MALLTKKVPAFGSHYFSMEGVISPHGQKLNMQSRIQKSSHGGNQKDIFRVVKEGSVADVELALAQLKKSGGCINSRNALGVTPLHIATWRNHVPIVKRLLVAGADPDARDGESGWSSLHRALHFGHLAVAGALLQSGASITLEDSKSRTPVDLLSGPVSQNLGDGKNSVATEVYSWGSGVNYQLGTGNAHIQKLPCKVDSLHDSVIKLVSAAKFHSVAVTARGELYTWGFGRGGRLGHPEFDIHSGQAAVITPRQVISGLGARRVRAVAAAKHHTIVATESGEVFTWGSNREGQLGYTSVDSQPIPRRVSSLKAKIVAVAAANKHTAAVSDSGEVYTWGCNKEGQLGYGTSNSGSNYTPRAVDYLKGKVFTHVTAAKYHTIVLGADGEIYTWGHRLVNPRRVIIARNLKKHGGTFMKFHRMVRLNVVSITAGMVHSLALTEDGALFYWISSDPDLKCQQLYSACPSNFVSISAGKYWCAAVTSTGDIYTWDGKKGKEKPPVVTRLHGIKRATSVSVGETHVLVVSSVYHPAYPLSMTINSPCSKLRIDDDLDGGFMFSDPEVEGVSSSVKKDVSYQKIPSLKSLCEQAAAKFLVEPRNAFQLLEIAESLDANDLRRHCEEIVVHNLDYIFTVSSHAISSAPLDALARLEKLLDTSSAESWSYRRLPTPTAVLPVIIDSEEEDESDLLRSRGNNAVSSISNMGKLKLHSFFLSEDDANQEMIKQVRALRKKLQQIEILEAKLSKGHALDDQQMAKLQKKSVLENSLSELGVAVESSLEQGAKVEKKMDMSKKQKRKNKSKPRPQDSVGDCTSEVELSPLKGSLDVELHVPMEQVEEPKGGVINQITKDSPNSSQKSSSPDLKKLNPIPGSKKKNRKGGLSMFLSGGLDHPPKVIPPPPPPKSEGPAWGGAKVSSTAAPLRKILDEQCKTGVNVVGRSKDIKEQVQLDKGNGKILLSSFLPSKPIPVVGSSSALSCDGDTNTPPWAASRTPPQLSRPSLRDIQMQQGKQHPVSHSPKTRTSGFTVNTSAGSPSDSAGSNRWYKPEVDSPSSLRSIQIEEKAMKDLRRFYSSVKLVKNQS